MIGSITPIEHLQFPKIPPPFLLISFEILFSLFWVSTNRSSILWPCFFVPLLLLSSLILLGLVRFRNLISCSSISGARTSPSLRTCHIVDFDPVQLLYRVGEARICGFGLGYEWKWFLALGLGTLTTDTELPLLVLLEAECWLRVLLLLLLVLLDPSPPRPMKSDLDTLRTIGTRNPDNPTSELTEWRKGSI